jgi:imidazoleglycerol-phosphate dehydratase
VAASRKPAKKAAGAKSAAGTKGAAGANRAAVGKTARKNAALKKGARATDSADESAPMSAPRKKAARHGAPATRFAAGRGTGRHAEVERKTSETDIRVALDLDGTGKASISTGVPFLDHMLDALSRHSLIDLEVTARGDTHIDDHHTVEDVGIAIGQALDQALGNKQGIGRFGYAEVPLDEALVAVTIDLSGRPFFVYNVKIRQHRVGAFDVELINDFLQALMNAAKMNLHVNQRYGRNAHHIIEATFKGLARALKLAVAVDPRVRGVPSTKGTLVD